MDFKEIHIGRFIEQKTAEQQIEIPRICNFLNCEEDDIKKMYKQESLNTYALLRWSKLLEYDFFRIYTQHLILYAPPSNEKSLVKGKEKTKLPQFRKNIYTEEIKNFILDKINKQENDSSSIEK